jgi:hypothetical protein
MTDDEGRDGTVADQQLLARRFEEQRTHLRAIDVLADPERLSRLDGVAG